MFAQLATALVEAENRGLDPNIVKPGWTALGIVALLCLATFILARSFLKHSRKALQPWEGEDPEVPTLEEQTQRPHERR